MQGLIPKAPACGLWMEPLLYICAICAICNGKCICIFFEQIMFLEELYELRYPCLKSQGRAGRCRAKAKICGPGWGKTAPKINSWIGLTCDNSDLCLIVIKEFLAMVIFQKYLVRSISTRQGRDVYGAGRNDDSP